MGDTTEKSQARRFDDRRRARAEAVQGDEDRPRGCFPATAATATRSRRPAPNRARWSRASWARRPSSRPGSSRRPASRRCRSGRRCPRRGTRSSATIGSRSSFTDLVGFSDWALEAGDDLVARAAARGRRGDRAPGGRAPRRGRQAPGRRDDGRLRRPRRRGRGAVRGARAPRWRRGRRVPSAYARWHARRHPAATRRRLPRRRRQRRGPGRRERLRRTSSSSPATRSRSSSPTRIAAQQEADASAPRACRSDVTAYSLKAER